MENEITMASMKVAILILLESFLQYENEIEMFNEFKYVAILILLESFLQ